MTVTLLLLWALMASAGDTPIGRMLRRGFVETPARFLDRVERKHVLLIAVLAGGVAGLVWLIGEESVRLMAMGAPDIASLLVAMDAATLIDALVATVLVAASVRLGAVRAWIGAVVRRSPAPRARRTRVRAERRADNDDEEPRGSAAA